MYKYSPSIFCIVYLKCKYTGTSAFLLAILSPGPCKGAGPVFTTHLQDRLPPQAREAKQPEVQPLPLLWLQVSIRSRVSLEQASNLHSWSLPAQACAGLEFRQPLGHAEQHFTSSWAGKPYLRVGWLFFQGGRRET